MDNVLSSAVIVPTLNAGSEWRSWIEALQATGVDEKDVYVVDSGSADDTVLLADNTGFNIIKISSNSFNHGGTRQMVIANIAGYDIAIFLTQDAILCFPDSLQKIISPFDDEQVAAVCGRQLPRKFSGAIEAHARLFNYSDVSCTNSIKDANIKGLKAAFISNSFAAYRISSLTDVGGFPENVIFGEDMYVAAKLLKADYKIAYAADACVYHSHNYSLMQEFRRYFDMGVYHSHEPWVRQDFGGAEGEGVKFVVSEFKYLLKYEAVLIPEAFLRTVLRYAGFRLGLLEQWIPLRSKKLFAMNKSFFKE